MFIRTGNISFIHVIIPKDFTKTCGILLYHVDRVYKEGLRNRWVEEGRGWGREGNNSSVTSDRGCSIKKRSSPNLETTLEALVNWFSVKKIWFGSNSVWDFMNPVWTLAKPTKPYETLRNLRNP